MGMLKSNNANRRSAGRWIATARPMAVTPAAGSRSGTCRWPVAAISVAAMFVAGPLSAPVFAQGAAATVPWATVTRLTTFGSSGFLAPGSSAYVTSSGDTQRGMAFNPATNNLVLIARQNVSGTSNNVVILNGTTGAISKMMNNTGVTGGSLFAINVAGVSDDGQIFATNLSSGSGQLFKVYKWPSESSSAAPTTAFQLSLPGSDGGNASWRFGDSFAVYGSGANIKFAAAGGSTGTTSTTISGSINGNFMIGSVDGTNFNTIYRGIPGTQTNNTANDYRLGLTFVDADTLIGCQGSPARMTDFITTGSGQTTSNATVTASINGASTNLGNNSNNRVIDYIQLGSRQFLATIAGNSNLISIFDITNPTSPVLTGTANITPSFNTNTNSTGAVAWGNVTITDGFFFSAPLYALNTNNGIQALVFTVPEPSTWAMLAAGAVTCGGAAVSRSRSRRRRSA